MLQFQKVFHKTFPGNQIVGSMIEYEGKLYIAVGRRNPNYLRIYRLDHPGCKIWQDVTPNWSPYPDPWNVPMTVFQDQLYVGTSTGWLHRIDTKMWPQPAPVFFSGDISSIAVFNGELYVLAGTLHHTTNGIQWNDLGPIFANSKGTKSYSEGTLAVFDGHLYAGSGYYIFDASTFMHSEEGIEIWRTSNGINWSEFKSIKDQMLSPAPQHVHAMQAFGKHLYIGGYEGSPGTIYRTDGSPGSWEEIGGAMPAGAIRSLAVHNGRLYSGLYVGGNAAHIYELLYSTVDGIKWAAVPGCPVGDTKTWGIVSMAKAGGRLYMGTKDENNGGEVYEMGDSLSICKLADIYDFSRKYITVLELTVKDLQSMKKDLQESQPLFPERTASMLKDIEYALADICFDRSIEPTQEMGLNYLHLVRQELERTSYFVKAVVTTIELADQSPILERALEHADRALEGYHLFLATLSDMEKSIEHL